jgi:CheY-like chemotaxis protein
MPRGGKLTLQTRNVALDEQYASTHLSVPPGSYVMLCVRDSGSGMDAETASHIFEPFFTTKGPGRGTGLGLSTVYGIVKQSGGSIWVDSQPDQGTSFRIYLPRIDEPMTGTEESAVEPESARGSETILVVEDDEMVRKLACQSLRMYGYQVVEAANAAEALLLGKAYQGPITLMLTDVVMPQMSGIELASRLNQLRPGMRVVYMSGYTDDAFLRHGALDPALFFLQKPFTPGSLAEKVREALDSKS